MVLSELNWIVTGLVRSALICYNLTYHIMKSKNSQLSMSSTICLTLFTHLLFIALSYLFER